MKCTKCGKQVKKTDKFCQYCGTTIKAEETKKTTTKKVASEKKEAVKKVTKTVEKEKPVKEEVKVETKEVQSRKKGFGIAGMVLGILSIVFCWCGLWVVIFPILGLIFSLISKKNGFKVVGLITSIVGFFLQIIVTLFTVLVFGSLTSIYNRYAAGEYEDLINEYEEKIEEKYDSYKYASLYGEWTCTPYPESSYTTKEETTLKFKYDGTYIYGPKDTLTNNYYSGNFTYEKEYDKNKLYTDREFMDVKATVDKFVLSGVEQDTTNKNLNMEFEFINDYKEAIIMFYNTSNTYRCKK